MTTTTNIAAPFTMTVTKGLPCRGISKGEVAREVTVTPVPGEGYRVSFKIRGRFFALWAASSARLAGGRFSLNTGDPTKRVVLEARV